MYYKAGACDGQSWCGAAGFANEGQLLLVNAASLADVDQRLSAQAKQPCADVSRFRPNLLVEGASAFAEDAWTSVSLGSALFNNAGQVLAQSWQSHPKLVCSRLGGPMLEVFVLDQWQRWQ